MYEKIKSFKLCNLRYLAVLYFVIYLCIGLLVVENFGLSVDDDAQRQHSLVAYKYINKVIFDRDVYELQKITELDDYVSKYYGTAVQLPFVFIEDLTDFTMTSREIYLMRHTGVFLVCFIGYIAFYFALRKIFKGDDLIPLIGVILISLYPRFYALQFVDVKNLLFVGLNMITMSALVFAVEKRSVVSLILFGVAAAFTINTRVMGIIYPAVLIGYFVVDDITGAIEARKGITDSQYSDKLLAKYMTPFFCCVVSWIVISPFAWRNPIEGFINCFKTFSQYGHKTKSVFMGTFVPYNEVPWHYLFVWFAISIPILYLVLFLVEHVHLAVDVCKAKNPWRQLITEDKWEACSLLLFWGSVGAVILMHSNLYLSWHHMYFVFVPFCVAACFGLKVFLKRLNPHAVIAVVAAFLIVQCAWMICNHPYGASYLNIIGKPYGDQFDRDEFRTSSYTALKWILENEEGDFSMSGETSARYLFTSEEYARIIKPEDGEPAQYYVTCYRNVIGNDLNRKGYDEVYTIWVDGYKICSVFKLSENDGTT